MSSANAGIELIQRQYAAGAVNYVTIAHRRSRPISRRAIAYVRALSSRSHRYRDVVSGAGRRLVESQ